MDATAMLDRDEHQPETAFVPTTVREELSFRKPSIEQYPQRNRAERRMAVKLARREQAKVHG